MSRYLPRILGTAVVLVFCACPLAAQEFSFGLQVHGTSPRSELKNDAGSTFGYGGTGFMMIDIYDGHAFKPRLDITTFTNQDFQKNTAGAGRNLKVSIYSLGVDYNFFPGRKAGEGWYLLLGAALDRTQTTWNSPTGRLSESMLKPGYSAGVGIIAAPHVGFEVKYLKGQYTAYDSSSRTVSASSNRVNFGFVFVF